MKTRRRLTSDVLYRRSPHVIVYWLSTGLILHNYRRGVRIAASGVVLDFLNVLPTWRTMADLIAVTRLERAVVARTLRTLLRFRMIERRDARNKDTASGAEVWESWGPAAEFFHFSTKDVRFVPFDQGRASLERTLSEHPVPPPMKPVRLDGAIALSPPVRLGRLTDALLERRTWRNYGCDPISLDDLSTVLGLTFKAQGELDLGRFGRALLKTSPSGGARHPVEAYVLAGNVRGLNAGLYYYSPLHKLLLIRRVQNPEKALGRFLPVQPWFQKAAFVVFMTALFRRTQWQYPFARAYRNVLIEAGHLCQTLCLVATAMGHAPFCTSALADTTLEHALRIDGVEESVLYAAGCGSRPGRAAATQ